MITSTPQLSSPDHTGSDIAQPSRLRSGIRRRELMLTTAMTLLFSTSSVLAGGVQGGLPWEPDAGAPPTAVTPGPWMYFTADEGAAIEALVDRLIPPDPKTPGGKDAGCAVFIDRQLAGGYGHHEGLYNLPPFHDGLEQQGPQGAKGPAEMYRAGRAALDRYCRAQSFAGQNGKRFAELAAESQDMVLRGLESKA